MPELPEVETVVRDLRPLLAGRTITGIRQSKQKLRHPWDAKWNPLVIGAKVTGLRRRGKWIAVDLDTPFLPPTPRQSSGARPAARAASGGPPGDHAVLVVHLGMTGQFTVVKADEPEPTHLHLAFELDNGRELRFRDQRRFGSVEYNPSAADNDYGLGTFLGWEPDDIDPDEFRGMLGVTKKNLKAILLDQAFVAGVGNIYADEALFLAKLHPARTGNSLTPAECDALRVAIGDVIERAIASRGSTIRDYVGGSGLKGGFQNEHAVYGREGEPCRECKTPIECVRLAGRASHFCPLCQQYSPQRTRRTQRKSPAKARKR